MMIPLVDLKAQHNEMRAMIDEAIRKVIDQSVFINGEPVRYFEEAFASYCNAAYAVGCSSGTDALKLALMGVGIKPGEIVITVPHTFIATVEAITMVGARPVFVDIDRQTYNMDPNSLAEYLEEKCLSNTEGKLIDKASGRTVTAILPVHLYGFPAHMEPILKLAEKYHLKVIEDACQAHGAFYQWAKGKSQKVGTLGHVAAFSFYPSKNLGAMGDAGALVTNDAEIAKLARILRDHGQKERYIHISPNGWNGRLDAIQAAILKIKLTRLDEWNHRRRQVAEWYKECLTGDERIVLPVELPYGYHVYHLYVIRVPRRDKVRAYLAERGIATGLHYPIPLHLQEAYRHLGYKKGDFPVAEEVASSVLSLPMYPHLTKNQVEYICESLQKALDSIV